MTYTAIIKTSPEYRVEKYQTYDTEQEAIDHAHLVSERYPDAFVVATPQAVVADWLVNIAEKTVSVVPIPKTKEEANAPILAQLAEIDTKTVRPQRAVLHAVANAMTPDPADLQYLAKLKLEADGLRSQLI